MAKAVANATTAAFITMVGSEFVQKYLGEGPRMVRDVFRLARENSPAIVFIDEIGMRRILLFTYPFRPAVIVKPLLHRCDCHEEIRRADWC